jgi:hypothetical protein
MGRTVAETIGRPATAKTGIRCRASLCHICDLQNGTWNGFSQSTAEFSCQHQCATLVFILTLLLSEGKAPNSGKLERKQLSFGCWGRLEVDRKLFSRCYALPWPSLPIRGRSGTAWDLLEKRIFSALRVECGASHHRSSNAVVFHLCGQR